MSFINYDPDEAANLALGQGGFEFFTDSTTHEASASNTKRWVSIMILQESAGSGDIELISNVGDDLTITSSWVSDLVGTVINGDFKSVNANGHDVLCFKG
jgi:hypothetical protein